MTNEELQKELEILKKSLYEQEQRIGGFVNRIMQIERKIRHLAK
jgi:hypothetical protein